PPIDGLIERPSGTFPLPAPKPGLADSLHTGCTPRHPELLWAALPRQLRQASLADMAGQLLVVSFSGRTLEDAGVKETVAALGEGSIGGVLYFRHNVASAGDVRAMNEAFATANPNLPALVAVDQEGGKVMRLRPSEGLPDTPAPRDVAKTSLARASSTYSAMAGALSDLGFTVNLGPVVDLDTYPANPVIGRHGRSFGKDPSEVTQFAKTFINAHADAGVATALKHFPGHGSSRADSHVGKADITRTWSRQELAPFRNLVRESGVDMVMVGHLDLAPLSGEANLPASLSPVAIESVLRQALCFDGLIVSDDLSMDAITDRWTLEDAAVLAIEAGSDVALMSLPGQSNSAKIAGIHQRIVDEANASPAFADKVRHAYARLVHHKLEAAERRALVAAMVDRSGFTRVADAR
ncbi:MAG: glycoside hydrolase family 3 N-terminal domain-containing protein, partial [Pseudomonadota bacterium]